MDAGNNTGLWFRKQKNSKISLETLEKRKFCSNTGTITVPKVTKGEKMREEFKNKDAVYVFPGTQFKKVILQLG